RVRMVAGIGFNRRRRTAVGVPLAQDRVDGAALDLVVAAEGVALGVVGRIVGVVGDGEPACLQLAYGGLELRHRGADVGQLDDVGFRLVGQVAQVPKVVSDALFVGQPVGELRQDAAGQRDVAGLDGDACRGCVGLDDG